MLRKTSKIPERERLWAIGREGASGGTLAPAGVERYVMMRHRVRYTMRIALLLALLVSLPRYVAGEGDEDTGSEDLDDMNATVSLPSLAPVQDLHQHAR